MQRFFPAKHLPHPVILNISEDFFDMSILCPSPAATPSRFAENSNVFIICNKKLIYHDLHFVHKCVKISHSLKARRLFFGPAAFNKENRGKGNTMSSFAKKAVILLIAALVLAGLCLCTASAQEVQEHNHYALCTDPTHCAVCGADYDGDLIDHADIDWGKYSFDDDNHWVQCNACNERVHESRHYSYCTDPNKCVECGAEYDGSNVQHFWASDYSWDENYHWTECLECGQKSGDLCAHYAYCDNPHKCVDCGADYNGEVMHYWASDLSFDDKYHWTECLECGEVAGGEKSEHYADCSNPTVCIDCGQEGVTMAWVNHNYDMENPLHDDAYHWYECKDCHEVINKEEHHIRCNKPGVCNECGIEYEGSAVSHFSVDWDNIQSDDTYHWYECADCGEKINYDEHFASCTNPDVCVECGKAVTNTDNVIHNVDFDDPQYDPDGHWFICQDCKQKVYESNHFASCTDPGKCAVCGIAYTGDNVSHEDVDWEHAQYDSEKHWNLCRACGEHVDEGEHYALCTSPTVCAACEAEGVTMAWINHNYDWDNYQYNDTMHWLTCPDCQEVVNRGEHYESCDNPGVCAECGRSDVTIAYTSHYIDDWDEWEHDETTHWHTCTQCGKKVEEDYSHWQSCDNPGVCATCGATGVKFAYTGHEYDWDDWKYDESSHWHVCTICNETVGKDFHYASCTNPGVCMECGQPYTGSRTEHNVDWSDPKHDANNHWYICLDCGQEVYKSDHYAACTKPGVCEVCGEAYTGEDLSHNYNWYDAKHDDDYHWWICKDCGQEIYKSEHIAACTNLGVCQDCGAAYTGENVDHYINWDDVKYDEESHWYVCLECGENVNYSDHFARCDADGICDICGYQTENVYHTYRSGVTVFTPVEGGHEFVCTTCGETIFEKHSFEDGVCYLCGAEEEEEPEPTPEPTPEPVDEPTDPPHQHDWYLVSTTAATCTEAGAQEYACNGCEDTLRIAIAAAGHSFGAYHGNGNGTHSAVCQNGCGTVRSRACEFEQTVINGISLHLCMICGDVDYTLVDEEPAEEGAEEAAAEETVSTVAAVVANATVEEAEEEAVPQGTVVIIRDLMNVVNKQREAMEAREKAAEDQPETVMMFSVALESNGEPAELNGRLTVSLPIAEDGEEEGQQLLRSLIENKDNAEKKLKLFVLINGEKVEIAYEIVENEDGWKLVFETEVLGIFVLEEALPEIE